MSTHMMMTCHTGSKLHKQVCGNCQRIVPISLTHYQELIKAAVLKCDLSATPITEFERFENPRTGRPYYVAHLICKVLLSGTSLDVELHWEESKVGSARIKDIGIGR